MSTLIVVRFATEDLEARHPFVLDTSTLDGDLRAESLFAIARRIDDGRLLEAEDHLRTLLAGIDLEAEPDGLRYVVFGAALARHLGARASQAANLYLEEFDVPQIDLFNALARHYTPVRLASEVSSRHIARLLRDRDEPILIDIGIGTGRQVESLIASIAGRPGCPKRMTVVGVEPSGRALDVAKENVARAAARANVDVAFHGVHASLEGISSARWDELARVARGAVISASFALHHVADVRGADVRTHALRRLRALEPAALVIVEPNVDHHDPRLLRRFHNAWSHFGPVFRLMDRLGMPACDRDALKVCFFGRELLDILVGENATRSERHESADSWCARLRAAGFSLSTVPVDEHDDGLVAVRSHDGFVGVDLEDVTSIAVFCALPSDNRSP